MKSKKFMSIMLVMAAIVGLAACDPAAKKASENVSIASDNFEVPRRISVVNGITDKVVMKMEGFCSLQRSSTINRMAVVCKTENGKFLKNLLDKSDNVFVLTEQLEAVEASTFHYRVIFRPQSLIPNIDIDINPKEMLKYPIQK